MRIDWTKKFHSCGRRMSNRKEFGHINELEGGKKKKKKKKKKKTETMFAFSLKITCFKSVIKYLVQLLNF